MTWVLHREEPVGFWVYEMKRSFLRRRPVVDDGAMGMNGKYVVVGFRRRWYNSETRLWDIEEPNAEAFIAMQLNNGRAVFDHRSRTMLTPA